MEDHVPGLVCPVCLTQVHLRRSEWVTMSTVTCPEGHEFVLRGRRATDTIERSMAAPESIEYVRVLERPPAPSDSWVLVVDPIHPSDASRTYDVPRLLWEAYQTARSGLAEAEAALEAYTEVAHSELDEWSH